MRYKDVANQLVASPALPIDKKTAFDAVSMAVVVLRSTSMLPVPSAVPINRKCWCCDWPIGDILVPHRVPPERQCHHRRVEVTDIYIFRNKGSFLLESFWILKRVYSCN